MAETRTAEPIVDREFAERLLRAVDLSALPRLVGGSPQGAIDADADLFRAFPGTTEFLAERHLPDPTTIDALADCAPGTLGHGDRTFVVDNGLETNVARNSREFNEQLTANGTLDRLPDDVSGPPIDPGGTC